MTKKPTRRYEGTPRDIREDARGARQMGLSAKEYEATPRDRQEDRAGQRRMQAAPRRPDGGKAKR